MLVFRTLENVVIAVFQTIYLYARISIHVFGVQYHFVD